KRSRGQTLPPPRHARESAHRAVERQQLHLHPARESIQFSRILLSISGHRGKHHCWSIPTLWYPTPADEQADQGKPALVTLPTKGARMSAPTPVLEARGISKSFGAVRALDDVNLSVFPGQIVALIGDIGAGKSTFINCMTGVFPPDSGEFLFDGKAVTMHSPQDARHLGIETVYQDLAV